MKSLNEEYRTRLYQRIEENNTFVHQIICKKTETETEKKNLITIALLCFKGPGKEAGLIPREGRPTISDELTSVKPSKRQTSIRLAAAILEGL